MTEPARLLRYITTALVLLLAALFTAQTGFLVAYADTGTSSAPAYAKGVVNQNQSRGDPVEVAQAWVLALNNHNLEGALALLNDGAFVIFIGPTDTTTTYEGKEQVQQLLQALAQDNFHAEFVEGPQLVNGTTSWIERETSGSLEQAGIASQDVSVDALIQNGKIRSIVYEVGGSPDSSGSVNNDPAGMPRTGQQSAALPLWLVALCIFSIYFGLRLRRRTESG